MSRVRNTAPTFLPEDHDIKNGIMNDNNDNYIDNDNDTDDNVNSTMSSMRHTAPTFLPG